jgi:hypothetical protein
MSTIAGICRVAPAERRTALRSFWLLARVAAHLQVSRLPAVLAAIDRRAARRPYRESLPAAESLRLLEAAARRLRPRPRCLVRALAGYELLRERGVDVRCVIGGRRGGPGFEAHAWLEIEGRVLLGGPVDGYQRIWHWPPE